MAQTFNTILSFVKSTSRKDRRKGVGSLSVSAVAGGGVGSAADSATQAWVRDNFVDKTTEQEISALKIFSQGIKIGDVSLFKHPDGYVYLDETLVLKGGVVMYGNGSGAEVPSIFDSLPIDGRTIKRDGNGALYVDETALSISGGGGGVADSVYWNNVIGKPSWIGSTKPTYKYSEIEERPDLSVYAKLTDIPSLNGYATQSWVEGKGYLLATTASDTYQPKITSSNKLAYSLISGTPDLSVYALNTSIPTKLSQLTDDVVAGNYLPLSGGTISTTNTDVLTINRQSSTSTAYIAFRGNGTLRGRFGFDASNNPVVQDLGYGTGNNILLHAGNYSNLLANGSINGSITAYLQKSITGYTLTSVENESCGLMRNSAITTEGNSADIWLYNTKDIKYRAANHYFTSGNVAIGGTAAEAKLHVHGDAIINGVASVIYKYGTSTDGTAILSVGSYKSNPYGLIFYSNGAQASSIQSQLFDNSLYTTLCLNHKGGNVAIGGTTADENLHVHGNVKASLFKSAQGYTLTSSAAAYCGLIPNNVITTSGNATDFWLYNTTDIKYYATKHIFLGDNVAIGDTTADAKLHVHGTAKFTGDTTFSSKVVIGTIPVYQSADGTLFVDANVVFRGGVAMHGNTTTTINEE